MSKFSKRHYIEVARVLRESKVQGKYEIAQELASMFQADNERFSFSKFYKAIGILYQGIGTGYLAVHEQ